MRGSDKQDGRQRAGTSRRALQAGTGVVGIPENKRMLQNTSNRRTVLSGLCFRKASLAALRGTVWKGQEWKEGDPLATATVQKKGKGSLGNRGVN